MDAKDIGVDNFYFGCLLNILGQDIDFNSNAKIICYYTSNKITKIQIIFTGED